MCGIHYRHTAPPLDSHAGPRHTPPPLIVAPVVGRLWDELSAASNEYRNSILSVRLADGEYLALVRQVRATTTNTSTTARHKPPTACREPPTADQTQAHRPPINHTAERPLLVDQ